jgi:hypothetical protein
VAVQYFRWVMGHYSNCCGLLEVGYGLLKQLLWMVSGGSWLSAAVAVGIISGSSIPTAIAVDQTRWVAGSYQNCCGQNEVGNGLVQQLLWTILNGSWVNAAAVGACIKWVMGRILAMAAETVGRSCLITAIAVHNGK